MDRAILENLMKRFPMKTLANGNIRTCPVRISWPNLVKGRNKGGKEKFDVTLLFPLGADLTVLNEALGAEFLKQHGDNWRNLVNAGKLKWPLHDQGRKFTADGKSLQDGCIAGAEWCVPKTEIKPRFVDARAQEVDASAIYPGCWALVTLHIYSGTAVDEETMAKIKYTTLGLNNIQFIADDERFGSGGATDPAEEFEPIDGTATTGFEGNAANGSAAPKGEYDFG
jgi:hypothetical protein